jgi:uncharacterized BrkB/YihY/UPF0761 family membrane protein
MSACQQEDAQFTALQSVHLLSVIYTIKNTYLPPMDEIITVEPYEWLIYIYSGLALTTVGFCLLIVLVLLEPSEADRVIPGMIAAMVCFITSLYFFSEGHSIKEERAISTDIYIGPEK